MRTPAPLRGDVWLVDLDPTRGHEQAGVRPGLVVSSTFFNHGPAGLVVVLAMTTRQRNIALHVRVEPPDGGVRRTTFVMCEDIRSAAKERFIERWGSVTGQTLDLIEERLRILLEL